MHLRPFFFVDAGGFYREGNFYFTIGINMATALNPDEYDLQDDLIPCEFCSELISMSQFIEHTTACNPELCSYPKNDGSDDHNEDDEEYHNEDERDDLDELINAMKITPKNPLNVKTVTNDMQQLKMEQVDHGSKYDITKVLHSEKSLKTSPKRSPGKILDDRIYNIKTKEDDDDNTKLKSSVNTKNQGKFSKFTLNNSTKVDGNRSSSSSGLNRSIQNNFKDTASPEEEDGALSSDDDTYETIESFWRRAAPILKKRLAETANAKPPNKFCVPDMTAKASVQKNQFSLNTDPRRSHSYY